MSNEEVIEKMKENIADKTAIQEPEIEVVQKNEFVEKDGYSEKRIDSSTVIRLYDVKRTSARKRGAARIEIIATEGEMTFTDIMTLKSTISVPAYQILDEAGGIMDGGEKGTEVEINDIAKLLDVFPKFLGKVLLTASFPKTEEEYDSFDDMVKISIMEALFRKYSDVGDNIAKK